MARTPEEQRKYDTERHRRWVQANPAKVRKHRDGWRARHWQIIDDAKDKPCADCGGSFPTVCMDLHHRDSGTKLFALSQWPAQTVPEGMTRAESILAEIAKCDVICANCHRMRHVDWYEAGRRPQAKVGDAREVPRARSAA